MSASLRRAIDLVESLDRLPVVCRLEARGFHHGQQDLSVVAEHDGEVVGRIDFAVFEGEPAIQYTEVAPAARRRGVATAMMKFLQKQYPETEIGGSGLTGDGVAFRSNLPTREVEDRPVRVRMDLLERLRGKLTALEQKAEGIIARGVPLSPEQYAELEPVYDMMNRIRDMADRLERALWDKRPTKRLIQTEDVRDVDLWESAGLDEGKEDLVKSVSGIEFSKWLRDAYGRLNGLAPREVYHGGHFGGGSVRDTKIGTEVTDPVLDFIKAHEAEITRKGWHVTNVEMNASKQYGGGALHKVTFEPSFSEQHAQSEPLYHVTSAKAAAHIEQHGLVPRESRYDLRYPAPRVYLATDQEVVGRVLRGFAKKDAEKGREPIDYVVFEVDPSGLELHRDPEMKGGVYTYDPVSASAMRQIEFTAAPPPASAW